MWVDRLNERTEMREKKEKKKKIESLREKDEETQVGALKEVSFKLVEAVFKKGKKKTCLLHV